MKVKLLKKIRKRYTIVHYPNGIPMRSDGNWMVLYDRENDYFDTVYKKIDNVSDEKKIYSELVEKIRKLIIENYLKYGTRRLAKKINVTLWHVGKK